MDTGLVFLWVSKESRFHEIESTPGKEAVKFIEMTTKSAYDKEVYVRIDWTQFAEHRYLEDSITPIKMAFCCFITIIPVPGMGKIFERMLPFVHGARWR